jgi:hypothetical protein
VHVMAVHEKVRDKVCDLCGYATFHKQALRSHLKSKHGMEQERRVDVVTFWDNGITRNLC